MLKKTYIKCLLVIIAFAMTNVAACAPGTGDVDHIVREDMKQDIDQVRTLGKAKNLVEIEQLASKLEAKWLAKSKERYAQVIQAICGTLTSWDFKDDKQYDLARQYASQALSKSYKLPENERISVEMEFALIGHTRLTKTSPSYFQVLARDPNWPGNRRELTKLQLLAWDRLEQAIDPNWDPNDHSGIQGFPQPPKGVGAWVQGMAPENIADPNLRAQYQADIEEYRQKIRLFRQQLGFRRIRKEELPRIRKYLLRLYSGPAFDSKQLDIQALADDLRKLVKNEKFITAILSDMNKFLLEQLKPKPAGRELGHRGSSTVRSSRQKK